ncbi:MAG: hypothetical protein GXO60_00035 [Epsilonproteobacteria bacterium]|nr:hypothetical protein [Campylobacterota bacterium]
MNLQKLVSMLLVTIIVTSNTYAAQCINCVAKINHTENIDDNIVIPFSIKKQEASDNTSDITYSDDENNPNYIIPLDDNEPSNIEIAENTNPDVEYQNINEENNSIVIIDETPKYDTDSNHSILDDEEILLYACDDAEHNTLICDSISKTCECV